MSDNDTTNEPPVDSIVGLRARAEALEAKLVESEQEARERSVRAELKVEAVRAGMIDLDGLKLLDPTKIRLNADAEIENAAELIAQLKRGKPWLFGGSSSSSPANVPPSQPPRQRLATEMTNEEYRSARAALLKRRW
jgi:hypothetical protein